MNRGEPLGRVGVGSSFPSPPPGFTYTPQLNLTVQLMSILLEEINPFFLLFLDFVLFFGLGQFVSNNRDASNATNLSGCHE